MEKDAGEETVELRVDGGATANNFLMQFQADLNQCSIKRPEIIETTALGAAYLAGLAIGYWKDMDEIRSLWKADESFEPKQDTKMMQSTLAYWHKAVDRSLNWING